MSKLEDGTEANAIVHNKPWILLMGLKRSGKTSIKRVIFNKMSPHETLWLKSTSKVTKSDISNSPFVQFTMWDFPGSFDISDKSFDASMFFGGCGALVFVIDGQEDNNSEAMSKLHRTVKMAYEINPKISFEVFIHKVESFADNKKTEFLRDIRQQLEEDLVDSKLDNIQLKWYLSSIYDHSIFEAFSKVVQNLTPQYDTLAIMLDRLSYHSKLEKAYLFDVVSKVYIATDSDPDDIHSYELCSDMIDVVIDVSCIYGPKDDPKGRGPADGKDGLTFDSDTSSIIRLDNSRRSNEVLYLRSVHNYLALVCLVREDNFDAAQPLIELNFRAFKEGLAEILARRNASMLRTLA